MTTSKYEWRDIRDSSGSVSRIDHQASKGTSLQQTLVSGSRLFNNLTGQLIGSVDWPLGFDLWVAYDARSRPFRHRGDFDTMEHAKRAVEDHLLSGDDRRAIRESK